MAQVAFTVRMDEKTKLLFEDQCEKFGMSVATAINMFAKSVIRERRIPFEIESCHDLSKKQREAMKALEEIGEESLRNGTYKMTLEEINAEIDAARRERDAKLAKHPNRRPRKSKAARVAY